MQVLHLFRKYILEYQYINEVPTKETFPARIHIFHYLNIASYIPNSTFPKAHLPWGKVKQYKKWTWVYLQYHTNTRLKFLQCKGCCQDLSTWFDVICILYSTSQVFLLNSLYCLQSPTPISTCLIQSAYFGSLAELTELNPILCLPNNLETTRETYVLNYIQCCRIRTPHNTIAFQ